MKVADNMVIPSHIGKITYSELADANVVYTRNGDNKELRQLAVNKFSIIGNEFHFEEGDNYLIVVKNDGY